LEEQAIYDKPDREAMLAFGAGGHIKQLIKEKEAGLTMASSHRLPFTLTVLSADVTIL
jgi:hypothetical protein